MNRYLRNAIISLIALFALIGVVVGLTNAQDVLAKVSIGLFTVACLFFIVSVIIWLFSWGYLIKKRTGVPIRNSIILGIGCFYGSLTPVQVGAEALRAIGMKEHFGVGYSESVAASMVAKGAKFCILGVIAVIVFALFFLGSAFDPLMTLAFFSGLSIIFLAVFLFISPTKRSFGVRIASVCERLGGRIPPMMRLAGFFENYSTYLSQTGKMRFFFVFALVAVSWVFEFLALQYSFLAMGTNLQLHSLLVLMVVISVLERAPFLPRGIGLVEFAGYHFLAFPALVAGTTLSIGQIGGILVVYDFVRIVVPTVLSITIGTLLLKIKLNSNNSNMRN